MNPHRAKFMRPSAQAAAAALKTRPCANCGEPSGNAFCQRCYALVDGVTKRSMRILFTLGSPKLALKRVLDKLEELRASGVPVPARKARREFDDDGGDRAALAPMARSNNSPGRSSCARPIVKISTGEGRAA